MKKILLLFAVLALLSPVVQAKGTARRYTDTFTAINKRFLNNLSPLAREISYSCDPRTPPEKMLDEALAILGDDALSSSEARASMAAAKRKEFLESPAAESWIKKRAEMRKVLSRTLASRLAPLRRDLKRMNSISPVPASMDKADVAVGQYVKAMNGVLDSYKYSVAKGTTDGSNLQGNMSQAIEYVEIALRRMGF